MRRLEFFFLLFLVLQYDFYSQQSIVHSILYFHLRFLYFFIYEFFGIYWKKEKNGIHFFSKTKRKRKKIKNILGIRSHPPTSNFSENYDFSRNWNYIFKIYLLFDIYNVFLLGNERIEFMAKSERKIQKVFQFLVSY